ncbi:MAG: DUF2461 domain-containing protein [Nocardioides sp.]
MSFEGFPATALDFYDDLEVDNTKSFWEAHKPIYQESVLAPMKALAAALEPEFGAVKIFRPYRDVRFSKDKVPYKTHQGAFAAVAPQTGYYLELSPRGIRTGGGCYRFEPARLAAFREAIVHDTYGAELERLLRAAARKGYDVGGEQLKTSPRGYDKDHPRIELLRHKSLTLGRVIGFEPVIHTAELLDVVRDDWRALRPTTEWIAHHAQA